MVEASIRARGASQRSRELWVHSKCSECLRGPREVIPRVRHVLAASCELVSEGRKLYPGGTMDRPPVSRACRRVLRRYFGLKPQLTIY